jgi:hypothetical protein
MAQAHPTALREIIECAIQFLRITGTNHNPRARTDQLPSEDQAQAA